MAMPKATNKPILMLSFIFVFSDLYSCGTVTSIIKIRKIPTKNAMLA
jgi:hypothetical protein